MHTSNSVWLLLSLFDRSYIGRLRVWVMFAVVNAVVSVNGFRSLFVLRIAAAVFGCHRQYPISSPCHFAVSEMVEVSAF